MSATAPSVDSAAVRVALDVSAVPPRPVGAGVYTVELARRLAGRDDVRLDLVARVGDAARWASIAPDAPVHAVVPGPRPARLAWEQIEAPRLVRRIGTDVWHGPHYTMPLRATTPAVVTVHDMTFFDHPEWHERAKVLYFRQMIRASARRASALVCVSEHTATRLREVLDPVAPVTVVHHGVDHARFRPPAADGAGTDRDLALLARHGITPPYVAFVGTLEPRKDVPTLVAAFARIARSHRGLRLALVGGDGWGVAEIREAIERSSVATRIVRTGYVPDPVVPALYRQAAAVAYPSREEGFGVPALEALACGAPLVTTTGSALEEVVDGAALTVPPHDVDALARALGDVLDDPARAAHLRAAGPVRASAFTWEASVDAHVAVYRRVARADKAA